MTTAQRLFDDVRSTLIVSCQASAGDAFRNSDAIARFSRAAVDGGARGIRANGPEDIRAIRAAVAVPVIGLHKAVVDDGKILITPTFEAARGLALAGADMIAVDCTARGQHRGALDLVRAIREQLHVPVLADIAETSEAVAAVAAGADAVSSTMRGYTDETHDITVFQPEFIRDLIRNCPVPVFAEGRVNTPGDARAALRAGAHAVIVGTAITRPHTITKWFVDAMSPLPESVVAIDMGGTNTKFGLVSSTGELRFQGSSPTPFSAGSKALLQHLQRTVQQVLDAAKDVPVRPAAVGIATAGWVDPQTGRVVYATENLPGWTGTAIAESIGGACGLPVAVENDANALAVGESVFGAARGVRNFICVTLGTGVGGGCFVDGKLIQGSHHLANAFGHIPCIPGGRACTCGLKGCLEAYANAAALLDYAGGRFTDAKALIEAAHQSDAVALQAIEQLADHLAIGLASLVQLLDPDLIVLSGGLAQSNPFLLTFLQKAVAARVTVPALRHLRIVASEFDSHGGVMGAAAVAIERI